jgi:ligand-binding sensor domain-containing protein
MNFIKFALLFVLTVTLQFTTNAQDWVSYQSEQKINDLVDTGTELLMATDVGLVVMNKSTLEKTIFNKWNSNLPSNHIQSITRGANGATWIGTYDVSLARFDGTDFQDIMIPEGDFNPNVFELYDVEVAPNGDLWVGTNKGIFQKEGQTWNQYEEEEVGDFLFEVWDIEINDAGEVFMATNNVHKFANGVWTNILEGTNLNNYLDADLFFSSTGDLYDVGGLDKIGRFDGTTWQEYDNTGLNGSQITGLTEDTDGNMYFNTQNDGIFKLENDVWVAQVDAQATAFDNKTDYFYIDADNNRWMSNNIHLTVSDNGTIQSTLISEYTIESNHIDNLHKGDNGSMYFMTGYNDNISVVDMDGNWSFLPLPSSLMPFEQINDMLFRADNDIWLATDNGFYHYDGNDWIQNESEACRSITTDSQGKIYVRATTKIYMIDNGVFTEYNTDNSAMTTFILSGHGIDANDNLWLSSFSWEGDNVIQKVSSDGTWTTYNGIEYAAIDRPVGDFHFDVNGNVWVPADVVGAIKFDGTDWTNPYEGNISEVEDYSAFSIESDATGKMYFSYEYGVTTWEDGVWGDFIIEDLPTNNTGHDTNIKFDDEGNLWFASIGNGVFVHTSKTSTSIDSDIEIITDFSIYPNPAADHTILDFSTPEKSNVSISIYNNIGQLLSNRDLGQLAEGEYQETISLKHLPKGAYFIKLQINDKYSTKTMIIR